MIDLTKPIRWKHSKVEVIVSEQFDDYVLIRWRGASDSLWAASVIDRNFIYRHIENIPSAPRTITLWPVWCDGDFSFATSKQSDADRAAKQYNGRVGKPVTITEEYP